MVAIIGIATRVLSTYLCLNYFILFPKQMSNLKKRKKKKKRNRKHIAMTNSSLDNYNWLSLKVIYVKQQILWQASICVCVSGSLSLSAFIY